MGAEGASVWVRSGFCRSLERALGLCVSGLQVRAQIRFRMQFSIKDMGFSMLEDVGFRGLGFRGFGFRGVGLGIQHMRRSLPRVAWPALMRSVNAGAERCALCQQIFALPTEAAMRMTPGILCQHCGVHRHCLVDEV